MFSYEQRRKAIETLIRFDRSYADTIRELGYPSRAMLRNWWKDYEEFGEVRPDKRTREPKYTDEMRRAAVDYYLEHGRSLARTMRAMGYPRSREYLSKWIDELAPGRRKVRRAGQADRDIPVEVKIEAVAALEARGGTAGEVADAYGVSRAAPCVWRRQLLSGDNAPDGSYVRGGNVRDSLDDLPDDVEELKRMATDLKRQLRALQLEIDVRRATAEILKKDQGADPNRLTNREKAAVVNRLRGEWRLKDLLSALGMAKSSYEYAARALEREPTEAELAAEAAVVEAFEEAGGAYGYRRVLRAVNAKPGVRIGEHRVRRVMRERHLAGAMPRRRRRYSSYEGEISEAPENTCLREDGTHDFSATTPNELWVTDVTEFRIPAGKCYLSPIVDCFDGMPIAWAISTSPDAEMANSALGEACARLGEGDHPRVHSDRGCHYRWPGWIRICEEHGLVRSMSRKGRSPDNSRMEGFFGRLKVEFFFGHDWQGVSMEEFMETLDDYLSWYRDGRLKSDLGYMSPAQYRRSLGLAA